MSGRLVVVTSRRLEQSLSGWLEVERVACGCYEQPRDGRGRRRGSAPEAAEHARTTSKVEDVECAAFEAFAMEMHGGAGQR